MKKINPFLWFDTQAEEAAQFYTSIFQNGKIGAVSRYTEAGPGPEGSVMVIQFSIAGCNFGALNGGPQFTFSPGVSYFVECETEPEIDALWNALSEGGKVYMEYGKWPFSEKYGWLEDRFGVAWQLSLAHKPQNISPALLLTKENFGKAEEMINFYTSQFPDSSVNFIARYEPGEGPDVGKIKYSDFTIAGTRFHTMESSASHNFTFSLANSFVANCETQEEIDRLWENLSEGGRKDQCGWLQDRYGVAWQIVPTAIARLFSTGTPEQRTNVAKALFTMKKIVIADLEAAHQAVETV